MKYKYLLFLYLLFSSVQLFAQTEFTVKLYDSQRERIVPIAVYEPKHINKKTSVVIFNHGYGQNATDSYVTYSCLTKPLAMKGYYVISIQHELPDDTPLAMTGEFMKTRLSNWERGVENIVFTIEQFKRLKPELNWNNLSVIGHSNGGDVAMLLATNHPTIAQKVISLDHRRMIIPRCSKPKIYTLRGSDYEADDNVIPTIEEQKTYQITVIKLDGVKHGDMDNKGTREQHNVVANYILGFLKD